MLCGTDELCKIMQCGPLERWCVVGHPPPTQCAADGGDRAIGNFHRVGEGAKIAAVIGSFHQPQHVGNAVEFVLSMPGGPNPPFDGADRGSTFSDELGESSQAQTSAQAQNSKVLPKRSHRVGMSLSTRRCESDAHDHNRESSCLKNS